METAAGSCSWQAHDSRGSKANGAIGDKRRAQSASQDFVSAGAMREREEEASGGPQQSEAVKSCT